jgi:hypothetical protein
MLLRDSVGGRTIRFRTIARPAFEDVTQTFESGTGLAHSWHVCVLFRYRVLPHPAGMATLAQKIEAETRMREVLADGGLPDPDRIEYGHGCIRLFFEESKVVLVIEIDDYCEVDKRLGIESR